MLFQESVLLGIRLVRSAPFSVLNSATFCWMMTSLRVSLNIELLFQLRRRFRSTVALWTQLFANLLSQPFSLFVQTGADIRINESANCFMLGHQQLRLVFRGS